LNQSCYEFLPTQCFQCFDTWNGTLTSVAGTYFGDAIITLSARSTHTQAQTGLGANNKNVNYGLSAWCNWELEKDCSVSYRSLKYIHHKDRICDLNVDLVNPPPIVSGDPHFIGFRGQRFDFHGEVDRVFNLVSDTNVQVNALFVNADLRPKKLHKTYIGELGILIGQHKLRFACNRGFDEHIISIDGEELIKSKPLHFADEKEAMIIRGVNDKLTIDYHPYILRAWFSSSRHSSCHITLRASFASATAMASPHGVLGQTANPLVHGQTAVGGVKSLQGEGLIEGHWTDYNIIGDDLFGSNFKYNRFDDSLDIEQTFLSQGQNEDGLEDSDMLSAASY